MEPSRRSRVRRRTAPGSLPLRVAQRVQFQAGLRRQRSDRAFLRRGDAWLSASWC